jgi:hypothetical protein
LPELLYSFVETGYESTVQNVINAVKRFIVDSLARKRGRSDREAISFFTGTKYQGDTEMDRSIHSQAVREDKLDKNKKTATQVLHLLMMMHAEKQFGR